MNDIDDTIFEEADEWLNNIVGEMGSGWLNDAAEVEPSRITSLATDTHTASERLYKGCQCHFTKTSITTGRHKTPN